MRWEGRMRWGRSGAEQITGCPEHHAPHSRTASCNRTTEQNRIEQHNTEQNNTIQNRTTQYRTEPGNSTMEGTHVRRYAPPHAHNRVDNNPPPPSPPTSPNLASSPRARAASPLPRRRRSPPPLPCPLSAAWTTPRRRRSLPSFRGAGAARRANTVRCPSRALT